MLGSICAAYVSPTESELGPLGFPLSGFKNVPCHSEGSTHHPWSPVQRETVSVLSLESSESHDGSRRVLSQARGCVLVS